MKFNKAVNSFASGEFSSDLRARFDLTQYQHAVAEAKNTNILRTGGITRREGTLIKWNKLASLTNSSYERKFMLIPFVHNDAIIYIQLYMYNNSITSHSDWRWFVWNSATNQLEEKEFGAGSTYLQLKAEQVENIQYAQLGDTLIVVDTTGESSPIVFYYQNAVGTTPDTLIYKDFYSYMGTDYPTWIPWVKPNKDTTLTMQVSNKNGSYEGKRIPPASRTSTCTVTCNKDFFTLDHVGRFIRININDSSQHREGIARIVGFTDSKNVTVEEWVGFNKNAVTSDDWSLSAISMNSNIPKWFTSIGTYQDRLIFGGTAIQRDTVYISMLANPKILMDYKLYQDATSDYSGCRYYGEVAATDAFALSITGQEGLVISFVAGINALVIGTNTRVFIGRSTDSSGFTPLTVEVVSEKAVACGFLQPAQTNQGICFADTSLKRAYIGRYVDNTGAFEIKDITLLNSATTNTKGNNWAHLYYDFDNVDKNVEGRLTQFCWDSRESVLYVTNNLGSYAVLTVEEGANTLGWTRNILVSHSSTSDTVPFNRPNTFNIYTVHKHPLDEHILFTGCDGVVDSGGYSLYPVILSYGAKSMDTLYSYYNFKLYLDGGVEGGNILYNPAADPDQLYDYWVELPDLDGMDYSLWGGTPYFVIKGKTDIHNNTYPIEHEYGPTILRNLDGVWYANVSHSSAKYIIGYPFTSQVTTLPIHIKTNSGTSRGNPARIDHATLIVDKTAGLEVFTNQNSDVIIDKTNTGEFETRDVKVALPHSTEEEVILGFKASTPMPFSVLGLVLEGVTYDD